MTDPQPKIQNPKSKIARGDYGGGGGCRLVYYREPGSFLVDCDWNGLVSLLKKGFFICKSVNDCKPDQKYVALEQPELDQLWQRLGSLDTDTVATFERTRFWDASYLVTEPCLSANRFTCLAGVITPHWRYRDGSNRVKWSFQVGLNWDYLPGAAVKLLNLVNCNTVTTTED